MPTPASATGWNAALTALAAALNIVGNVVGGRLLQQGLPPVRLLRWGFVVMALGGVAAFLRSRGARGRLRACRRPCATWRSACSRSAGGMVPATLVHAPACGWRLAPPRSRPTVGMMQQASSFGQFIAPPAVAWLAHRMGGWQWTWIVTLACSLAGLALARRRRHLRDPAEGRGMIERRMPSSARRRPKPTRGAGSSAR